MSETVAIPGEQAEVERAFVEAREGGWPTLKAVEIASFGLREGTGDEAEAMGRACLILVRLGWLTSEPTRQERIDLSRDRPHFQRREE